MSGLDYAIIIYLFLSGFVGIWRGFFREVFGLISWAVAILGMVIGVPRLANLFQNWIKTRVFAEILSVLIISTLLILLVTYTFKRMGEYIKKSRHRNKDRIFGFAFGLMRSILLMMILFVLLQIGSPKELERWEKNSVFLTPIGFVVRGIEDFLPAAIIADVVDTEKEMPKPEVKEEPLKREKIRNPVVKEADIVVVDEPSDIPPPLTEEQIEETLEPFNEDAMPPLLEEPRNAPRD